MAKPIDPYANSEDKLIIDLKKQGYNDDAVAKQLAIEGYKEYSAKRIQCRWLRLKKIVEQKEEERLDDELSDWHIGEVRQPISALISMLTVYRMISSASASMPWRPNTKLTC